MSTFYFDFAAREKKIGECVRDVLTVKNCRRATAYISAKETVKATLQRRLDRRKKQATVLVTIGQPNFVERRFIRLCKKSGEVFPLTRVQWKFWPKKGARK